MSDVERIAAVRARLRLDAPFDEWVHINTAVPEDFERLREFGVDLTGPDRFLSHDFWFRTPSPHASIISIYIEVAEKCAFVIEEPGHLRASFYVIGSNNMFASTGAPNMPGPIVIRGEFHGEGNTLIFGEGSTSNGTRFVVQGGQVIDVRKDCMFADGITIRSTDNHGILDLRTGEIVNATADVTIGPHVWLGQEVIVFRGVEIGAGTVVGARSVVSRSLPSGVVALGTPAAISRVGVSWTRNLYPSEAEKRAAGRYAESERRAPIFATEVFPNAAWADIPVARIEGWASDTPPLTDLPPPVEYIPDRPASALVPDGAGPPESPTITPDPVFVDPVSAFGEVKDTRDLPEQSAATSDHALAADEAFGLPELSATTADPVLAADDEAVNRPESPPVPADPVVALGDRRPKRPRDADPPTDVSSD